MLDSYRDGRLYDRLFEQCVTDNQLHHLNACLDNRLTPGESIALANHIKREYTERGIRRRITWLRIERDRRRQRRREFVAGAPRPAPRYLRALHATQAADTILQFLSLSKRPPAPINRLWSRGAATLYRSDVEGPRTLVIAFTAAIDGFMMPTTMFLQFAGEHPVDVLKLASPKYGSYVNGVRPFSQDFPTTIAWLRDFAQRGDYARTVAVGASSGSIPALLTGAHLGTDSVLAAGPAALSKGDQLANQLGAASSLEAVSGMPKQCDVNIAYGELSTRDTETAGQLATVLPQARIIPVAGANHACLFELAERDELADLIAQVVLGRRPSEILSP